MSFVSKKNRNTMKMAGHAPIVGQQALAPAAGEGLPELLDHNLAVMVVNEEADILDEVAALLRRRGLAVHLASSASEARAILLQQPDIGVLVADIGMLEGEGLTLAAHVLGGKSSLPPVELVLITGYTGHGRDSSTQLMHRVGLLQEPLKLRDIAVAVGQAIGRSAARRAMSQAGTFRTYDAD